MLVSTAVASPQLVSAAAVPYFGEESIEERIVNADIIVKAELDRITTEIVTSTTEGWSGKYYVALEFHLTVGEYLSGTGANTITALWVDGLPFDTQQEAEAAAPGVVASRDTTWDDREAILFLQADDFYGTFSTSVQGADDYFLAIGGAHTHDMFSEDFYSLHNKYSKLWLPSAGTAGTGDSQEFLLAVPETGVVTPTITLGVLKSIIAPINAELNAGDGTDAFITCVRNKYTGERIEQSRSSSLDRYFEPTWGGSFSSGLPAGSELYEYDHGQVVTEDGIETKSKFWIDGDDAVLFSITEGSRRPDPDRDRMLFIYSVVSARPIPAGTYTFNHHYIPVGFLPCGRTSTFEMTVNVPLPDGVLHELLFDPVTVGTTVASDGTNGVLEPGTFTKPNGASATIEGIAWEPPETDSEESGTVKLEINPVSGNRGLTIDFIELDGTASLTLNAADATVDATNNTLSWSHDSQPWENGDKLMLRIRSASLP